MTDIAVHLGLIPDGEPNRENLHQLAHIQKKTIIKTD